VCKSTRTCRAVTSLEIPIVSISMAAIGLAPRELCSVAMLHCAASAQMHRPSSPCSLPQPRITQTNFCSTWRLAVAAPSSLLLHSLVTVCHQHPNPFIVLREAHGGVQQRGPQPQQQHVAAGRRFVIYPRPAALRQRRAAVARPTRRTCGRRGAASGARCGSARQV